MYTKIETIVTRNRLTGMLHIHIFVDSLPAGRVSYSNNYHVEVPIPGACESSQTSYQVHVIPEAVGSSRTAEQSPVPEETASHGGMQEANTLRSTKPKYTTQNESSRVL
jgi:hypothetical protein